jgi:hypothetical protein
VRTTDVCATLDDLRTAFGDVFDETLDEVLDEALDEAFTEWRTRRRCVGVEVVPVVPRHVAAAAIIKTSVAKTRKALSMVRPNLQRVAAGA